MKHIAITILAALASTMLAAMHGVMGESLFELLGGEHAQPQLLIVTFALFALLTICFWKRAHIAHWLGLSDAPPPPAHHSRLIELQSLMLVLLVAGAQGVLAFSTAHMVGEWVHGAAMIWLGAIVFFGASLLLWWHRDKLFHVAAKVAPIDMTAAPFHAVVTCLSIASPHGKSDDEHFADARALFDTQLKNHGWADALAALTASDRPFWNMQVPLRIMRDMAHKPAASGHRRMMVFITTELSDARWEAASDFLRHIAEKMPDSPQIEIMHGCELLGGGARSTCQLLPSQFAENLDLIQRLLKAIQALGIDPKATAVDTTSGTVDMSVAGAMATINQAAAFIYSNTNDGVVRRYDANAHGVWSAE